MIYVRKLTKLKTTMSFLPRELVSKFQKFSEKEKKGKQESALYYSA